MKWIGQQIYDLASRFRNDVFLEDISSGTIASGAHLGLDSNNKIVKAVDGGGDVTLAGIQTFTGAKIIATDVKLGFRDNNSYIYSPTANDLEIVATDIVLDAATLVKIETSDLTMYDPVNSGNPTISLGSSATNRFEIKTAYNSGAQTLDEVYFNTYTASTSTNDGRYIWQVDEVELARLIDDGLNVSGYINAADTGAFVSTVNTSASSATEGGRLRLICDDGAAMGDDHRLGVVQFEGAEDSSSNRQIGASIQAMCDAAWSASENGTRLEFYTMDGNASSELSLTLDSNLLATFAGGVTVTGTITGDVTGDLTGQAATVATIAGLAPNTATTQATQPAIESIGTDGDTLKILADELLMSNTTADAPVIKLVNTTNDDQASQLIFEKLRADDAVAAGQNIGEIWFRGQDAAQNTQNYGFVLGEIDVSTSGQESGKVSLGIANHDGGNGRGLILIGGSENDEVDATLGLGANSIITIPGNIDLAGDIDVDGTLETDALTINGAAVLAQATASAVGAVELATTAEADTGTDTARAVTPAGLKSHVDANARKCILRHHAFYVNDNPMVQNSLYFGGNLGHQPSNWNDPQAAGGVIGDTASFTISKADENWGMVLPFDISKVEVQCSLQPQLGTSDDFTVAIYTGIRGDDSAAALTLTLVAHNSISFSSSANRYVQNDVSVTADYAKGTMIYVGVGSEDATDAKNGRGYLTVTVTER